ncbi:MAG: TIGR04282 family arsenosugar biosynthesis glycosyltransferase, partial [Chthoniobacterales bacterium]
MTKAPRSGKVKTRLSPPLSPDEAASLNICFLRDLSLAIKSAGAPAQGVACYTPIGEEEIYASILPSDFQLIAQRDGLFGERLCGAVEDLLTAGFGSVGLINSDSPTVPAEVFAEAARVLSESTEKVVLGPTDDGGYYLIGMKRL